VSSTLETRARLNRLIFGHVFTQCVYVVAKLGVVDTVPPGGVLRSDAVAEHIGVQSDALYRVLRALAGEGLFTEVAPRAFEITEMGELLRDGGASPRYMALMHGSFWMPLFEDFMDSLRTGLPITVVKEGRSHWEILADHPEESETFNRAMEGRAAALVQTLLLLDWTDVRTVVDVGGGMGGVLLPLLVQEPHLRGVLFDLEHVAADGRTAIAAAGVGDRCEVESGSFFERVPTSGDVYILSNVLHDWYDEDAIRIAQACRAAMGTSSKLVVLENLVHEGDEPEWSKTLDILMLAGPGGRERTEDEYRGLLAAAGIELDSVVGDGPVALVGRPV
jgi:hypothetical protein